MAFRVNPRTVWGTRRWFLGREWYERDATYEEYIKLRFPDKTAEWYARLDTQMGQTMRAEYAADKAAGEAKIKVESWQSKVSTGVYYLNQIARTVWWYATETGAAEKLLSKSDQERLNMIMGVTTSMMGLIATVGAVAATSNPAMATVAAFSIPIQLVNMFEGIQETDHNIRIREYHERRLKRLGIPLSFLDY